MKVTVIKEEKYVSNLKVNEFIRSLITLKMDINDKSEKKCESMAFKVVVEEGNNQLKGDTNENLTEYILFLAKIFGKFMRRLDRRSSNNVTNNVKHNLTRNSKGFNPRHKGK